MLAHEFPDIKDARAVLEGEKAALEELPVVERLPVWCGKVMGRFALHLGTVYLL